MARPNQQDATLYLYLRIAEQIGRQSEARQWSFTSFDAKTYAEMNQKYPRGSKEREHITNVLGFYESAGVLVSRKLHHEDVFFDAPFGFEMVWGKIGPFIRKWQQAANDPAAWENVEWLGKRYEWWQKNVWKPKMQVNPPNVSKPKKAKSG